MKLIKLEQDCQFFSTATNGTKYSRMDQVKLLKTAFRKFEGKWSASLQIF